VTRASVSAPIEARPLDAPPPPAAPKEVPKEAPRQATAEFMWPAKGKVLAGFAEPRSKGIDIDGRPGDPVVAAAAGRVTYTGTGIPGLGKLVVIKHDNGFITVYAHNRSILVKEQQSVARGQQIAELGASDADRPKLHFQIRKGAAAVDPLRYLPAL
jgi:lipoprotein NlpD